MSLARRVFLSPIQSILILLVVLSGAARADELDHLEIITDSGVHAFVVELALSGNKRTIGLMHREHMDENAGMLFRFDSTRPVSMWMKNTLIPLDMIFIRADGTVARIHRNAVPLSEKVISSGEPVLYVLELNGGIADKIGVDPEDRVIHPIINAD
ncbi:MAG: DUF192 domain-containing protein [Alphaproteobacteria bacterium]|nr:DUF192 domain-containing protein [Alphaproteobacteria bacterium]